MPKKKEFDGHLLIRIAKEDIAALDAVARTKGTKRSKLVREILQRYIKRHTTKPKIKYPA